jgi:hypothetical protein
LLLKATTLSAGSYSVTIGAGGAGSTDTSVKGVSGTNTTFGALYTADGGGGGGSNSNQSGLAGGSSGGAGSNSTSNSDTVDPSGNAITIPSGSGGATIDQQLFEQGSAGSTSLAANSGGGGGGAAFIGSGGARKWAGNGEWNSERGYGGMGARLDVWGEATGEGHRLSYTSGTATFWAGGGSGGNVENNGLPQSFGGGGFGGDSGRLPGSGDANTGGGGGGSTDNDNAASGGSGIVIVRYAV